ncbi:hypothetical protein OU798_06295 [Prolixibacteraceae bacterium Z1-6]|uniref:Uncharacterized protein n=1 Tax=Draconibacterium aestuarii TaxID=2998507 RepID=A0A9X3FBN4_9BACT|nr:hypothetical protein [Prolixibacteraceae bacterium Z1-6]
MKQTIKNSIKKVYSQACVYHIILQGKITLALLDSIDDMQIRENGKGEINLIGWLPDQSALIGLLNHLNEIRYGILSVKALMNE